MGFFDGIMSAIGDVAGPAIDMVTGAFDGGIPIGSLISAGTSLFGTEQTNTANAAQAAMNRAFQADQTGTAYQRAVKDMSAAGLNPMLAYSQGGASSGGGAQATMQNSLGAAVGSFQQQRQLDANLDVASATAAKARAEAHVADTQAALNAATVPKVQAETVQSTSSAAHLDQQVRNLAEEINRVRSSTALIEAQRRWGNVKTPAEYADLMAGARLKGFELGKGEQLLPAIKRGLTAEAGLSELAIPQARNLAESQSSWWMRNVSPYLSDFSKVTTSAAGAAASGKYIFGGK